MDFCDTYLHNAVRQFLESVRKRYNECDEAFRESNDLLDKIVYTKEKINRDDLRFFAHLREFYNVLKENKKEELENRKKDKETKKFKRCLEQSGVIGITNVSKCRKTGHMEAVLTAVKHENEYEGAIQPSCVSGEITGQIVCSNFPNGADDVVQEEENYGIKGKMNNKSDSDQDTPEWLTCQFTALDELRENKLHEMKIKKGKAYLPLDCPESCMVEKYKKVPEISNYDQANYLNVNAKGTDVAIHKFQSQDEDEGEKHSDKKLSATASQREVKNGDSKTRSESCCRRINESTSKHGLKHVKRIESALKSDSSSSDFEDYFNRFHAGTKQMNKSNSNYFNGSLNSQTLPKNSQKERRGHISKGSIRKGRGKKRVCKNKIPVVIVTESESDTDFDYTQSTPRNWKKRGTEQVCKNKIPVVTVTDIESDSDFDYIQSTPKTWKKRQNTALID